MRCCQRRRRTSGRHVLVLSSVATSLSTLGILPGACLVLAHVGSGSCLWGARLHRRLRFACFMRMSVHIRMSVSISCSRESPLSTPTGRCCRYQHKKQVSARSVISFRQADTRTGALTLVKPGAGVGLRLLLCKMGAHMSCDSWSSKGGGVGGGGEALLAIENAASACKLTDVRRLQCSSNASLLLVR